MARLFSTRLDEALIDRLDRAARRLGTSKQRLVEQALRAHLHQLIGGEDDEEDDLLTRTSGAWKRREKPAATVRKVRGAFRESLARKERKP